MSRRSGRIWSRRGFLAAAALQLPAAVRKGSFSPSEKVRYLDPATEFFVQRLTEPTYSSFLPDSGSRFISRRRNAILYASDRSGSLQAWRLDPEDGRSRLLTEASDLSVRSLTLLPGDRDFLYVDGGELFQGSLNGSGGKSIYEFPAGFDGEGCVTVTDDGAHACLTETKGSLWRVRLVDLKSGKAKTVVESVEKLDDVQPRPGHRSLSYRSSGGQLWTIDFSGKKRRRVASAAGRVGQTHWTSGGVSLLYLLFPAEKGQLNTVREYFADSRQDRLVAKTTQFVSFGANANSSVFVGASGGRATPHVILMLRTGGRELTICEHAASDPTQVKPVFSPNSRWIFFESDRHGKAAIYSMKVDDLVEATERQT